MNSRRSRNNRNGGKRSFGSGGNRSYESNGPDVKVRGTASQIFDKYLALARDATASGDRIAAEGYYQHAEHYYRLYMNSIEQNTNRPQRQQHPHGGGGGDDGQQPAMEAAAGGRTPADNDGFEPDYSDAEVRS